MKKVSIVLPLLNEVGTLGELYRALASALDGVDYDFELIFVDDGSSDGSLTLLEDLIAKEPRIRVLSLARNFGHQAALLAGIEASVGEAVILMDTDLQDDPAAIHEFLRCWEDGFQVVYAVRVKRKESVAKRAAFRVFYRIQRLFVQVPMPLDAGIFGLMDRQVVEVLRRMPEKNRYLVGLRAYVGFRQIGVPVERGPRFAGEAKSLRRLIHLALDGIFAFSTVPLRLVTLLGLLCAGAAMLLAAVGLFYKFVLHQHFLDWPYGLSVAFFFGGVQLVSVGIIGEYVGRIYEEVKQRPHYVVARRMGFEESGQ